MTTLPSTNTSPSIENRRFYLLVAEVFFGITSGLMFVFAVTFIRDIQTLRNVPDALWNFLCGTPTDNNVTLPLLLTIGIVLLGITISLEIWRWRLTKP